MTSWSRSLEKTFLQGAVGIAIVGLGFFAMDVLRPVVSRTVQGPAVVSYRWRFEDLYQVREGRVLAQPLSPTRVRTFVPLSWIGEAERTYRVQVSSQPDFVRRFSVQAQGAETDLEMAFVGENYWRVAGADGIWSPTAHFRLEADFLPDPPPRLEAPERELISTSEGQAAVLVRMVSSAPMAGFVIESSTTAAFETGSTLRFRVRTSEALLSFASPGLHHVRVRAMNERHELTAWSAVRRFRVMAPAHPFLAAGSSQ